MKQDYLKLERRRMRAAQLLEKGFSQAEVARRVGVRRSSVNRWALRLKAEGKAALKHPGHTGRPPQLNEAQQKRVIEALLRGPEDYGWPNGLWTLPRVALLIGKLTGVHYHPGHVSRLLHGWKFSCQKPKGRAVQRDEKAIATWKRSTWPMIKKKPGKKSAPSSSSMNPA